MLSDGAQICAYCVIFRSSPPLHPHYTSLGHNWGGWHTHGSHGDNYRHHTLTLIQYRHNLISLCFCLNTSLGNGQTTDMIYFLNINAVDVEFIKITINIIRFGFKISKKGLVMRVSVVYFLDTFCHSWMKGFKARHMNQILKNSNSSDYFGC